MATFALSRSVLPVNNVAGVQSRKAPTAAVRLSTPKKSVTTSFNGLRSVGIQSSFSGSTTGLKFNKRSLVCPVARTNMDVVAFKVAVLGAAGGIGQPMSMLLKMNPMITELALYDIANTPGVAADLSHVNTPAKVTGFVGDEEIEAALTGCDLVIIPAGVPRKPGMTRDDLFGINAGICKSLCEACAKYCPKAVLNIIANPVNSTVPIAAEVYKKAGVYDPKKIMGVSCLDIVRSNTFVAELKGLDLSEVDVPVIGGHAGITILPLLSQVTPSVSFTDEEIEALTVRIQNAGTEVVEAKAGAGSATLSMAYAGARMADSTLKGLAGEPDVYECTYVASDATELAFFATKCKLGKDGVETVMPIGDITEYEQGWLEKLKTEVEGSIAKGIEFANK
mmetsp:Transcript_7535/g.10192  ORF Transcript_7535/g.10192 Transcript_7535/m.10192 type:complete len:394 (-) Transcript_7535:284-1465(-)|eukprot:CAMPEP_0196579832 /NCGR_PEP_ID=MMETSP1081-20130531/25073_1 /TAXON_ID=36882 /ORGANISM="Pyramimonas amylifera, Strain CCMP720" /LENGTH=393 /DNA_ID=CAMNT_0041899531 /DNA_START=42 /DNA_END=1223 /DNA_ORIENTATION=+